MNHMNGFLNFLKVLKYLQRSKEKLNISDSNKTVGKLKKTVGRIQAM